MILGIIVLAVPAVYLISILISFISWTKDCITEDSTNLVQLNQKFANEKLYSEERFRCVEPLNEYAGECHEFPPV